MEPMNQVPKCLKGEFCVPSEFAFFYFSVKVSSYRYSIYLTTHRPLMKLEELARYDIKLLVAFQVLLEERSVSRAAERLFVTQSAMSKMLNRMTDMFGAELFIRTTHGIEATEHALALQSQLTATLDHLNQLVSPQHFDPALCDRTFRISLMDHLATRVCPPLFKTLNHLAPHVKLQIKPWSKTSLEQLANGQLDLAINIVEVERANFYQHVLSEIIPCAIVRKDHPLALQDHFTLDEFLSYSFVKVVIPEFNETHQKDQAILEALGKQRHIALETHNINCALMTLATTDFIMLGGQSSNQALLAQLNLTSIDIPSEVATPNFSYKAIWHQRQHKPAEQVWFRQLLLDHLPL